ncbi:MAG: ATP-dependent nuclease subunit B [Clostridiales bacterium]|nr:ATP-dependent nuclease subunit B [Clostridiales bacterium]
MLSICVGRAGSGKSDQVLKEIEKNRASRPQILLVPEHTSHGAEVDLCLACGDTASADAEVLSFRNLATRVLAVTGGLADFTLDGGGKILTMQLALQEVRSKLKVFGRPSQKAAFLQQMVDLMEEFASYEVLPETLYTHVEGVEGATGDKLRDLALIYAVYDGKLHTEVQDARGFMQKLRDNLAASRYIEGKDVYVDGFSYFTALEEDILGMMLRQAHSVTVTLLGEKGNSTLFQNALGQGERRIRLGQSAGVRTELHYLPSQKADTPLAHLETHFFGSDIPWEKPTDAVEVYRCGTAYSECAFVAGRILSLVRSGKYRFRDITVVARDMTVYGPILENVLARYEIPAYQSRRSDILQKPALALLLGALDAVTGGFEYEDVFGYLKTGLSGVTAAECDLIENYVILWQIRGNMWLRDVPWTANPDGYGGEMTEERVARLKEINRIREKIREPLSFLYEKMKDGGTAREKAEALYLFSEKAGVPQALSEKTADLLEKGEAQLSAEYGQLWDIFCGVLDQFAEILGDAETDGETFARLLRLVLSQYSVGTIPATLDQVKVSEITRNDRHRVKCLFLLGANDHVLPSVTGGTGILNPSERETLQKQDVCLSDATFDQLDQELQNIYASLAQPTEKLVVSYPVTDLNGGELRPAFVVERLKRLFPALTEQQEDNVYRYAARIPALEAAGEHPGGALWQYFADKESYASQLTAMERAAAMERGRLSPAAVQSLYGKSIRMSASRMDRVKSCHFSYFMQYGLKAKERKAAGFEAPEIGTFLHYLLENVTRDVMARGGYGAVEPKELKRLIDSYVKKYTETEIDHYQEKSARFRYLFGRLQRSAEAMIENVAAELAESDFVPMAFELEFSDKGPLPAITIEEAGTALSVVGKVDRVDGWLHEGKLYLRVVDYKTGKKAFDLSEVRYGLGIQMLLYLFTLQNEGAAFFGNPIVPAGVLYLPARDVILRESRTVSEEKLQQEFSRELRRSGMVLSEPEVLQAMEHSALENPCYLPLRVGKGGNLSGGLASAEQLGKLGKYVESLLHQIAREMRQGNIDADPFCRTPEDSACAYCEFASACGFEEGHGRDRRRYLKKTTDDEFWQDIEKDRGEEDK